MLIELQEPFKSVWRKGYLRVCSDGRKRVDLVNSSSDRTTISYARYQLSGLLGRLLGYLEEADHIDEDKTNDALENLQVLGRKEHKIKTSKRKSRTYVDLTCSQCLKEFKRERRQVKHTANPMCSRRCNGIYSRANRGWKRVPHNHATLGGDT